jgi:putative oxidoreductase
MKRSIIAFVAGALAAIDPVSAFSVGGSSIASRRQQQSASPVALRMAAEPETKKETTLDRIFGPKLFKTVTNWEGIHSVPLVPLRIMTGLLMIHHGSEGGIGPANIGTPEFQGFIDFIIKPYFGWLPGSPVFWSALHDYFEYIGGICFALGFLTRPAALSLFATMSFAVYFHLSSVGWQGFPLGHVSNYSYDFEEPMLYALIFLMFWFNGAGPLSIDSIIYSQISTEEEAPGTAESSSE